jgi:hypothetical protein
MTSATLHYTLGRWQKAEGVKFEEKGKFCAMTSFRLWSGEARAKILFFSLKTLRKFDRIYSKKNAIH